LACEKKIAFWGCWTLTGGMRVWKIRKSTEYLNLMLTVLIHLYETFVLQDKVVPDDYFCDIDTPPEARAIHERLVNLTADIIDMKRPDIAELYKEYPAEDTKALVHQVFVADPTKTIEMVLKPNLAKFPDIPPWVPAYASIGMFGYALSPRTPNWQTKPTNILARLMNLTLLFEEMQELCFIGPILDSIRAGCSGLDNFDGFESHENVKMMRVDRMERLTVLALRTMMSPQLSPEDRPTVRDLAKMSNTVPGGIDRVFGLYPCNMMFLAIRKLDNPGIELEIGLNYYTKIAPNIN